MTRSSKIRSLSVLTAMLLPVVAFAATGTTSAKSTSASATKHPAHLASKTKHAPAVDINTASKEDLMKLPGVTDETAQKIIDNRPYKSKVELSKKNVLTKAEYGKVRNHVVARQEKPAEAKSMESTPTTK